MDDDIVSKYKKAGKIAAKVRDLAAGMVKPGVRLLDVAETAEAKIRELGGYPAFPINISLNDIAAHYTPGISDASVFSETDVVKIDVGAHVDGYIGDTAMTVCLDKDKEPLFSAARAALKAALDMVEPGAKISEIGQTIQAEIESFGFKPISNLTGHGLDQFNVHAKPAMPNIKTRSAGTLEAGMCVAIEPFATDGRGAIKEGGRLEIFSYYRERPVRLPAARKILKMSQNTFKGMPFATRWIKGIPQLVVESSLRKLADCEAVATYPILREIGGGIVAQAEHTIIVSDKPVVTTKTSKF